MSRTALLQTIGTSALTSVMVVITALAINHELQHPTVTITEKEIVSRQLHDITSSLKSVFANQPAYPDGNLMPFVSGAKSDADYIGFVPYVIADSRAKRVENAKHDLAMEGLSFSDNGTVLTSRQMGRIEITGSGQQATVSLPDCPATLCSTQQYIF